MRGYYLYQRFYHLLSKLYKQILSDKRFKHKIRLNEKFVALDSHSGAGGLRGNDAVRDMFSYVGVNVLSREIINNYSKEGQEGDG